MAEYTTLASIKDRLEITSSDEADDRVIMTAVRAASALMAGETHREFVAVSETRYFDVPDNSTLEVDDFTSLTSITNGDGTTIPLTEVVYLPGNKSPKWAVRIKPSSAYYWSGDSSGNTVQTITIVGLWGYSDDAPDDVAAAVEDIVVNKYKSRHGVGAEGVATITASGVVITPKDITPFAKMVIDRYKRLS
jgi:hypothetical protein